MDDISLDRDVSHPGDSSLVENAELFTHLMACELRALTLALLPWEIGSVGKG